MKKVLYLFMVFVCVLLTGCGNANVAGSLTDIMDKLYAGIGEEELPMALNNIKVDEENFSMYLNDAKDIKYKEILASDSMVGSIPHSVVLIRLEKASDSAKVVKEIKDHANPRKWICVEAENVEVLAKGDLVVLIMTNELAPKIKANFENLK